MVLKSTNASRANNLCLIYFLRYLFYEFDTMDIVNNVPVWLIIACVGTISETKIQKMLFFLLIRVLELSSKVLPFGKIK